MIYGQTRILYAMGRDGLLPPPFTRVSARTGTPVWNTLVVGAAVAVLAAVFPLKLLADMTSMGTLVAFSAVSVGIIVLRRTRPDLPRGFKVPFYPVTPLLSAACCVYLITKLHTDTFVAFAIVLACAAVLYFGYSAKHSRLARTP